MANKLPPAPFLSKTFQIVDDPATNNVISWSESGDTFIVWSLSHFAEQFLPIYFKHNNFSSFVRQLNTYGFRKIGSDKWEFANDNFRRGQVELLSQIRRRKTLTPSPHKSGDGGNSDPSNSGDDIGSTSSSNLGSVDTGTMFADLTEEIEKLKKQNEMLSSELAEKKKQCEEYAVFLAGHFKVGPDEIDNMVKKGNNGEVVKCDGKKEAEEEEEDGEDNGGGTLKLFGVWLKAKREKKVKRGRDEKLEGSASCNPPPHAKAMKSVEANAPGMASTRWLTSDLARV